MARRRDNIIEDIVEVVSRLPWWAGVTLALISYLALHFYAGIPVAKPTGPGQMGSVVVTGFIKTFALFGQIVLPFAFLLGAFISVIKSRKQRRVYENVAQTGTIDALEGMGWHEFELMVAEFFNRRGFASTLTQSGADGGMDIVLKKGSDTYLVQCKQWKAYKVGVQAVREFYGVMAANGAAGGYFVTSGEFTAEATKFAEGTNIRLVDGQKLMAMIREVRQPKPMAMADMVKPSPEAVPDCPKCGADMTKRVARSGTHAAKTFWGCSTYPRCRGVREAVN